MKKSIIVLSILLPAIALAQTTTVEAPKKLEQTVKLLNTCDLEDGGIALSLTDKQLKITGSLPKDCADRLSLSSVKHFNSSKSADELSEVSLDKTEDLKEYAATIQAQVTFSSDEQNKTLRDCVANAKADSEKVDLGMDPHFAKTVSHGSEIAIAGIMGDPMDLKSPEFIKMEKQIAKLECKDCNSNWIKTKAHLKEAHSPLLNAWMNKLLEGAMADLEKKITETKNLSELERLSKQLDEMKEFVTNEGHRSMEIALRLKMGERNSFFMASPERKPYEATRHVEFAKNTYAKIAEIPGLPSDQREEYMNKAEELAVGKPARIELLSMVDGRNKEVRDYLETSDRAQRNLQMQIQATCGGRMNQHNFTQCSALQSKYQANQQRVSQVQSRFILRTNETWGSIFSYWDKKNIAYDQSWHTTFMNQTAQNTSKPQGYFYTPNSTGQYQNIDTSKMYQPNTVMPESLPFYSEQPYSIVPANS